MTDQQDRAPSGAGRDGIDALLELMGEPYKLPAPTRPILEGRYPDWVWHAARLGYDPHDIVRHYNESIRRRLEPLDQS